jgi:hypothetical protein
MGIDNSTDPYSYTERFVSFIDIIGFEEIINKTISHPPEISIENIISALAIPDPAQEGKLIIGNVGDISKSGHKITQFSDSIVISTEPTKAGLLHLIDHIERIAFSLLKMGFLCRGGISKGLHYHKGNIVFGPAFLDAYDLEKHKATWPRIILSKEVENFVLSMDGGERTVIERKLIKYPDFYFVNVLRLLSFALDTSGDSDNWERIYFDIKQHIRNEMARLINKPKEHGYVVSFNEYFDNTVHADELKLLKITLKKYIYT